MKFAAIVLTGTESFARKRQCVKNARRGEWLAESLKLKLVLSQLYE